MEVDKAMGHHRIRIRRGRERLALGRRPWIFGGAFDPEQEILVGDAG